jgi:signal transduction histidine kinase/ligand-binding sensor domain-containing protein
MFPCAAKRNFFCGFGIIFTFVVVGLFSAPAVPVNYFTRTWQVEQGLPQNKVTAVVQTRDGYLWVGTYCGLARFDGIHFTIFNDNNTPELRSSRITSLFEAADGSLWIGTESGDISHYQDGRFAALPVHPNWSGGKIYAITADDTGDVWLMNEAGELARVRDGKVMSPPSGGVLGVVSLARAQDGTIWFEREGAISSLKGGKLTPELSTNDYVQGFCAARDGGFWVGCNGRIRKWKDGEWTADLGEAPWKANVVANLLETSSGALAAGTSGDGLWLFFPNQTNTPALHFDYLNGFPSDWVISLWEDREKNLWCGTGGGLAVIRRNNLEIISPPDKWKSRPVLSVLPMPDGTLWIGTEGAGLYRLYNGDWTNFNVEQGIGNPYVWSVAADSTGTIWAGSWGGGIYVQKYDAFDYAPGLENFRSPAPALLFLHDELWIGTPSGALHYRNGKHERFNEFAGEPFGDVRVIAQDKSGTLWFGTAGSGLVRSKDGKFVRFRKSSGLSSDFIECLYFAEDGSLWIGTLGGGLNRFADGKFSVVSSKKGLPNDIIGHIESDGRGFLWMSSYGGILRASENDLNRCANGEIEEAPFLTYGINDGLPTLECSEGLQSGGGKSVDGRLWFPTAKGLVAVDPARVETNSLPPPVRVEEMRVDEKKFADDRAGRQLKIPPGRHRIEFQYTALSFVAPEKVRFKCRLNNFETDWANVGAKRTVTYNYIPPGDYSFQVIACNDDGIWNETGAILAFRVLPYFWQTAWFRFFTGLAVLLASSGIVWADARRRLRHRMEKMERERTMERERSRIAQDIHDDLGASLTRIAMLSESVRGEKNVPEPVSKNLDRIFGTARELTRAMDEIVWAVNPRHDTLDSLANYLSRFAHDYLSAANIRCRLDVPLQLPPLPVTAEIRHNLFLAFKEALHNIVQHGAAAEVRVELKLEAAQLTLRVADDGRGFDAATPIDGRAKDRIARGNGLANMRRRLVDIGGACEISSKPGMGTTVVFSLPFARSI